MRRLPLDQALADGEDPARNAQLAARAAFLARPSTRMSIAAALERLAEPLPGAGAGNWRIPASAPAVRANRGELLALAGLLRSDRRLYVGGIAQLQLVVIDGTGPAYSDPRGEALARQLELARAALAG